MRAINELLEMAQSNVNHIVLAEGTDSRVASAAERAVRDKLARVTLLGDPKKVRSILATVDQQCGDITIVDPRTSPLTDLFAEEYSQLQSESGVDNAAARDAVRNPLVFGAMMVRKKYANGTIAGAVATTADTMRTALRVIGPAKGVETVSSCLLVILRKDYHTRKGSFIFADCGLVVEPDARTLSQIAISSAETYRELLNGIPHVALLSFSTDGSVQHERVEKVVEAARLARLNQPGLSVEGELQFDAAFEPEVRSRKAPSSRLEGTANVLIFPNLESGNIGCKIAERIGGAEVIGPILQGLASPANDLSRGCSSEDIYHMIAVTSVQATRASQKAES